MERHLAVLRGRGYHLHQLYTGFAGLARMIEDLDLPATILRPAYFIQNDLRLKEPLLNYGMPIGSKGISMVDIRDMGMRRSFSSLPRRGSLVPLCIR